MAHNMSSLVVAVVSETFAPDINGVACTLRHLVQGLVAHGAEVLLTIPEQSQAHDIDGIQTCYVRGFSIPLYRNLQFGVPATGEIKRQWHNKKPHVAYIATEGPLGWAAVKMARKLDIPTLSGFHTNFHSYSDYYRLGWLKSISISYLRHLHNRTQATLVPTVSQQKLLQSLRFQSVDVLSHGVDCQLFSPTKCCEALRQSWGARSQDLVCIYVGRLAKEKNIQLAIDAYQAAKQRASSLKFVVVGEGPLDKVLKKRYPDIIFAGPQQGETLAKHYASADIFLFPSLTETFGLVTIEAMASGLAVIAFDYAAAHMCIDQAQTGVLVRYDKPDEFIYAVHAMVSYAPQIENMRQNAVCRAQKLQWDCITEQFEQKLLSLIKIENLPHTIRSEYLAL